MPPEPPPTSSATAASSRTSRRFSTNTYETRALGSNQRLLKSLQIRHVPTPKALTHGTYPPLRMAGENHCGVDEKTDDHTSTPQ